MVSRFARGSLPPDKLGMAAASFAKASAAALRAMARQVGGPGEAATTSAHLLQHTLDTAAVVDEAEFVEVVDDIEVLGREGDLGVG